MAKEEELNARFDSEQTYHSMPLRQEKRLACMGAISGFASLINTHLVTMFPLETYGSTDLCFSASVIDVLIYGGAGLGSAFFGFMIDSAGFSSMFITWAIVSILSVFFMLKSKRHDLLRL